MTMIMTLTLLLLSICGALSAIYFWRKTLNQESILKEGGRLYEELRSQKDHLQRVISNLEESLSLEKRATEAAKSESQEGRDKNAMLVDQLEAKENEIQYVTEKLQLQKGHLQKQLDKTHGELQKARDSQLATETKIKDQVESWQKKTKVLEQSLAEKDKAAEAQAKSIARDKEKLNRMIKTIDPVEINKVKRKIIQSDRLYQSMRGLREMADERNRNWEVALAKLSTWILKHHVKAQILPKDIGPLVGEALEAIGEQIVKDPDEFAFDCEPESKTNQSPQPREDLESKSAPGAEDSESASAEKLSRPRQDEPIASKGL
jgi:chromosome segregation ATPase